MEKLAVEVTQGIQEQANKTINELKTQGLAKNSQIKNLEAQLKESQNELKKAQLQKEENAKLISTLKVAKTTSLVATAVKILRLKAEQTATLQRVQEETNEKAKQKLERQASNYEKQKTELEKKQAELTQALSRANSSEAKLAEAIKRLENLEQEVTEASLKAKEIIGQPNITTVLRNIEGATTPENLNNVHKQHISIINKNNSLKTALKSRQEKLIKVRETKQRVLTSLGAIKEFKSAEKQGRLKKLKAELIRAKNLTRIQKLESEITDLLDKPQIILLLNKIPAGKKAASDLNTGTLDSMELIGDTSAAKKNGSEFIREKLINFRADHVNVFFNGPSGSGKTTLFEGFTGKNLDTNTEIKVTAYIPTFTFTNGVLKISDRVQKNITYGEFKTNYIRPTPFNPQSSRAHMSYEITTTKNNRNSFGGKEKLRVFDLAGAENPMAIMFLTFGFNIFDEQYMNSSSWDNMGEIPQTIIKKQNKEIMSFLMYINSDTLAQFLKGLGRPLRIEEQNTYKEFLKADENSRNSDGLSKLAETFIFWLIYGSTASPVSTKPGRNSDKYINILKYHRHKTVSELKQNSSFYNSKIPSTYDDMIVCKFLYESFKRMIEGFYITRSLFSLRYAFTSASADISGSLAGLKKMKVNSKHIAPFTNSKNSMSINFKDQRLAATISKKFKNSSTPFVPIPDNMSEINYTTNFLNQVLEKDGNIQYKNLIVGVVNGNPPDSIKDQQKVAIDYLKTLTPAGMVN